MQITINDNHEYIINTGGSDFVAPSVTQIIKSMGLIDDTWYKPSGTTRGMDVHELSVLIDCGETNLHVHDSCLPYVRGYLSFLSQYEPIWMHREEPFYCGLGFAGTPDRIGIIKDYEKVILDIKTGKKEKWHGLQLAGYAIGTNKPDYELYSLYLSDNEKFKLEKWDKKNLLSDWLQILKTYKLREVYL